MKDPDAGVREAARRGLQSFSYRTVVADGAKGTKFVGMDLDPLVVGPPLRRMLDDADPEVAKSALQALQALKITPRTR